jgi:hypothetical protein
LAARWLLAALSCAAPLFADPTYIGFQVPGNQGGSNYDTIPTSINLSGTVTGYFNSEAETGFVRDPSGTITIFGQPYQNHHGLTTYPTAINSAGTIVGTWKETDGMPHSFMRDSNGTVTLLYPCHMSGATGINEEGAIVGVCLNPSGPSYVLYPDGKFHTFEVKGAGVTSVVGINVAHVVTGSYTDADGKHHGFVGWPNSDLLTTFDPPGSTSTWIAGINSFGAIAGSYTDAANVSHGFVRNPLGKIVSFDPLGSRGTSVGAINNFGAIVGGYVDSRGVVHGFVRDPLGVIISFDFPGSLNTRAVSINDHGVITGLSGGGTGFVRTP